MSALSAKSQRNPSLPGEAREGLMRAWLALLQEKHPGLSWIEAPDRAQQESNERDQRPAQQPVAGTSG